MRSAFQWVRQGVVVAASKLSPPILTFDTYKEIWRLEETYSYKDGEYLITMPAGFESDLASVPRIFWWLIAPFELSIVGSLIHDYLYQYCGNPPKGVSPPYTYTRQETDALFRRVMEKENVVWWRRELAYWVVRRFGCWAWRLVRPLKRRGPISKRVQDLLRRTVGWIEARQPSRHQILFSLPGVIVILAFATFIFLWQVKSAWRPVLAPIGTGLGALLGIVPGLLSKRMRGQWVSAIAGSLLVALVTWYTTVSSESDRKALEKELETKRNAIEHLEKRFQLVNGDLQAYVKLLPNEDQSLVIMQAAKALPKRFQDAMKTWPPDFDSTRDLISLIHSIDNMNGHALYFLGEIGRKTGHREKGHQEFFRYIEGEEHYRLHLTNGGTNIAACYESATGYCRQRSAWIRHLLANDFYQDGLAHKKAFPADTTAVGDFQSALKDICEILYNLKPGGFRDPDQLIPTEELERRLRDELRDLGHQSQPCSLT